MRTHWKSHIHRLDPSWLFHNEMGTEFILLGFLFFWVVQSVRFSLVTVALMFFTADLILLILKRTLLKVRFSPCMVHNMNKRFPWPHFIRIQQLCITHVPLCFVICDIAGCPSGSQSHVHLMKCEGEIKTRYPGGPRCCLGCVRSKRRCEWVE